MRGCCLRHRLIPSLDEPLVCQQRCVSYHLLALSTQERAERDVKSHGKVSEESAARLKHYQVR